MDWIDPWEVLGLEVGANHDAIVAAFRAFARANHPDRMGDATPEERAAAEQRMAQASYAYELLTDPEAASRHRQRFQRLKARGYAPEPPSRAPRSTQSTPPAAAPPSPSAPTPSPPSESTPEQRQRAAGEFPAANRSQGTPWTARGTRRGRWRRR